MWNMSAFVESASAVSSTPDIQTNLEGHTHFSKVTCIHSCANPTHWGPGMSYLGLPVLRIHHEKNQPYPWVIGSQESDCSQGVECLGCRENLGQPWLDPPSRPVSGSQGSPSPVSGSHHSTPHTHPRLPSLPSLCQPAIPTPAECG